MVRIKMPQRGRNQSEQFLPSGRSEPRQRRLPISQNRPPQRPPRRDGNRTRQQAVSTARSAESAGSIVGLLLRYPCVSTLRPEVSLDGFATAIGRNRLLFDQLLVEGAERNNPQSMWPGPRYEDN